MTTAEHIFIPFKDGMPMLDRQGYARTFNSVESYNKLNKSEDGVALIEYAPVVEAYWEDITEPGQVTCGGNLYYACGRCGNHYGSFSIIPRATYCENCGAKMKLRGVD